MTTAPFPADTTAGPRQTLGSMLREVEQGLVTFLADERSRWSTVDSRAAIPVQAVTTLVEAGGKRLRPAFCLSGYLAAGGEPGERALRAAIALELLHVSALLHDDVMDDSDERRDMPTAHAMHGAIHRSNEWWGESRRYGESVAILAGDLAWAYADYLMADLSPEVSRQWLELRAELISGQMLDIATAAGYTADPELARHIAVVKSGRYTIHRPLVLGSTLAGRTDLAGVFEVYGEALGEAFQLRDDLIDAFGDGRTSGKPAGLDFKQHKMTVLLTLAMEQDDAIHDLVENCEFGLLRERLISVGVPGKVEARIGELVQRAQRTIGEAPLDPGWRRQLCTMATQVAHRDN